MLISIIIPVFNAEKFLSETIESALNQTYTDTEIILIDDASTDKSKTIIENFQRKYPEKIRTIFHTINTGESVARKNGLLASHGEYIYLLDADDRMYPDTLERMIDSAQKTDIKVIVGHRDRINVNSEIINKDSSARWQKMIIPNIASILMIHNPLTPGNVLVSRSILYPADFEESLRYGEDWILFIRLAHRSQFYCIGDKPIYSYRYHNEQQSNGKVSFSERKKVLSFIYNEASVQKKYSRSKLMVLYLIGYSRHFIWHMITKYKNKNPV